MSTSAYIITKHNGYYWGAMCNWDGYPDGLGSDLLNMTMADKNSNTDVDVIDFYRLSLFFKNNNPQEFKGEDYQEHIFRDKTPDNIITIRSK